jgi:hypothetical protein
MPRQSGISEIWPDFGCRKSSIGRTGGSRCLDDRRHDSLESNPCQKSSSSPCASSCREDCDDSKRSQADGAAVRSPLHSRRPADDTVEAIPAKKCRLESSRRHGCDGARRPAEDGSGDSRINDDRKICDIAESVTRLSSSDEASAASVVAKCENTADGRLLTTKPLGSRSTADGSMRASAFQILTREVELARSRKNNLTSSVAVGDSSNNSRLPVDTDKDDEEKRIHSSDKTSTEDATTGELDGKPMVLSLSGSGDNDGRSASLRLSSAVANGE